MMAANVLSATVTSTKADVDSAYLLLLVSVVTAIHDWYTPGSSGSLTPWKSPQSNRSIAGDPIGLSSESTSWLYSATVLNPGGHDATDPPTVRIVQSAEIVAKSSSSSLVMMQPVACDASTNSNKLPSTSFFMMVPLGVSAARLDDA